MSELTITHYVKSDIPIIKLAGKITIGEGSVALRVCIHKYLSEGKERIIVDVRDVSYVDSSGIGEIVLSFIAANKVGGTVVYVNPSFALLNQLTIQKLTDILHIYSSVEEAAREIKKLSPLNLTK